MSLQKVILPDYVLANLYADCLVGAVISSVTGSSPEPTIAASIQGSVSNDKPYRYLGKNNRRTAIIAGYSGDPYMPEDHLEFLVKILAACKLNLGDVAILNHHEAGIDIGKLKLELTPVNVLLFGVEPAEIGLPLSFPMFKPQLFDGTNFLAIPPIGKLNQETNTAKSSKKLLWECLKKIFLS